MQKSKEVLFSRYIHHRSGGRGIYYSENSKERNGMMDFTWILVVVWILPLRKL